MSRTWGRRIRRHSRQTGRTTAGGMDIELMVAASAPLDIRGRGSPAQPNGPADSCVCLVPHASCRLPTAVCCPLPLCSSLERLCHKQCVPGKTQFTCGSGARDVFGAVVNVSSSHLGKAVLESTREGKLCVTSTCAIPKCAGTALRLAGR